MKTTLPVLTLAALTCASAAIADSIETRRSTRMRHADTRITLADIAELKGSHATKHASLVIDRFRDTSRPMTITVDAVSEALDRAGVNWARVELSGGSTVVRPYAGHRSRAVDPAVCKPLVLDQKGPDAAERERNLERPVPTTELPILTIDPRDIVNEDTPRGLIAIRMADLWRGCEKPVRMHLQTSGTQLLNETGLRPRVSSIGRIANGTGRFKVVMEEHGVIEVEAYVEIESLSHRARVDLARGERIGHQDIESSTEWIRLQGADDRRAGLDIILGGTLDRNVKADMRFEARDFVPTIRRNDAIQVRSRSTGFNLALACVSLEDGHVGDTIQVKPDTPGTRSRSDQVLRVVIIDSNTAETLN
ncbi:MAG: flagella basal body P-ring formation protein FlgA [Planctomycetota bacterium]|nr:flagella basal body P-ring formation protein FlgA [Planctomycetota bacterium]